MDRSRIAQAAARPFKALFGADAFAGVLLIAVALVAMGVANSPLAQGYHALFHTPLPWTPVARLDTLHLWINDGLMALFFFVVGLEMKREVVAGHLADPRSRRLPVLAAVAGMAMPALVFLALAGGDPRILPGWAIPAATDIAFAMGVVGLLGRRMPVTLRLFLLTVAIVDDIGAVAIIALFYTASLEPAWLVAGLAVLAGMVALNRAAVARTWPYALAAALLWFCVLHSGIHATIAGVLAALAIPMAARSGRPLLEDMEHALTGWNAHLVVPLFALANAGVALDATGFGTGLGAGLGAGASPLPLAIAGGLVLGKQAGIFLAVWAAERSGFAPRPAHCTWPQVWGAALLCGIGFTMSLFIAGLAFADQPLLADQAKIGVLAGSALAALLGYVVLRLSGGRPAAG